MLVYHFINEENGLDDLRRKQLKIATFKELNDPFEMLAVTSDDPDRRRTIRRIKDEHGRDNGLLCFSKTWKNPVQWSHYADKHRGLCLGFEVPNAKLMRVQYSKKRLQLPSDTRTNTGSLTKEFAMKLLNTKSYDWKYESEMRVGCRLSEVEKATNMNFANFSAELALKEVMAGAECKITRNELNLALGALASDVKCCKVRLAFKTFMVTRQRQNELWQ